jgi:4-diphosphocytidyl-2-C-methyl-D-erythritol kinase
MIAFPHAKINLGLNVISKRPDGFHNLETVFYPLPLNDVLEIVAAKKTWLFPSGLDIHGEISDNLVLRAYHLLQKKYSKVGGLEIYLHKAIPLGAGLGGGSADAAKTLQLVNGFFELNIPKETLAEYALELGSDCPFFLQSDPCFATGRGEILEPVKLDLSGYSFLLIHPGVHVNTTRAFSGIKPVKPTHDLKKSILQPISEWKTNVHNIFEISLFEDHPFLRQIKEKLYESGALYASMTGSGSTLYGIFPKGALPELRLDGTSQTHIP